MSNPNEESYLRTVAELQELARRAPHVTHEWVLQVASMDPGDMRRRLICSRDWHGHFSHVLDGIKEIRCISGAGIDGCRDHRHVRTIVEKLVSERPLSWEKSYQGIPKQNAVTPKVDIAAQWSMEEVAALRLVVEMAEPHIKDIESSIDEGLNSTSENQGLELKRRALLIVEKLVATIEKHVASNEVQPSEVDVESKVERES